MSIEVLFVDHEINVLKSIRRSLRQQKQWKQHFCNQADQALAIMEQRSITVVISCVHIRVHSQQTLLDAIESQYPEVIRIALSGDTQTATMVEGFRHAHQYLTKPCDSASLITAIEKATHEYSALNNPALAALLPKIKTLPSPPAIYSAVSAALNDPDSSLRDVGLLVEQDPTMASKILQVVNSPFFALPHPVQSVVQATSLLGTKTLMSLILSEHLFNQYSHNVTAIDIGALWQHSQRVSALSKHFAQRIGLDKNSIEQVTTAGLLHDIGKLVLIVNMTDRYLAVLEKVNTEGCQQTTAEIELFGCHHAIIGAHLLNIWGLPSDIVNLVARHHTEAAMRVETPSAISVLSLANCLLAPPATGLIDWQALASERPSIAHQINDYASSFNAFCERTGAL